MTHNDTILEKVSGSAKLLRVLWASQRGQRLLKGVTQRCSKVFQRCFDGTGLYRALPFPTHDESDVTTDPGNCLVVTGPAQGTPPKKMRNDI